MAQSTTNMTREDLKKHIRALTHELDLSTLINKGAIQENKELKLRVAELEQENAALRTTEARLTDTEERLEECEQVVKEKESQIRRLKEAVNGLKSSMRDAISERDKWSRRWSRVVELVDKEEEDIADSIVSESTNQASFASEKVVNNPPARQVFSERPARQSLQTRPAAGSTSSLAALFDDDEAGGPSKPRSGLRPQSSKASLSNLFEEDEELSGPSRARSEAQSQLSKKKRRRIGDVSEPEDEPYRPAKPMTPVAQTRQPSSREKRKPNVTLGIVKLETPTPEPQETLPLSKASRSKKPQAGTNEREESDDEIGQW